MLIPGLLVGVPCWLLPRLVPLRAVSWLLATLAIWGALLRMPMYGACSLLMAAGLGRLIGDAVAAPGLDSRRLRRISAAFAGVLGVLAVGTSGWQAVRESRAVAALPAPPPQARNVVLIVWDTVRAYNVSSYGHPRDTTPNLRRWAQRGVQYNYTLAPAPWTFPSHVSFFTGQWPLRTNTQWKMKLDAPDPTLAEYLASHGYQTAGFAANTNCCTYESGLDRGFAHYEDYSLAPLSILARTVPGQWILPKILRLGGFYNLEKWVRLQSRDAGGINGSFLAWLGQRRLDRPFFAFLNYFDAHEPYVPPANFEGRFGIRPRGRLDHEFLLDFTAIEKDERPVRDMYMARDCYDDCIAYLDEQLGHLLDQLESQGLLANTDVIITSDHGEEFAEHGIVGHAYSVKLNEVAVPLVILSPGAPAGRSVFGPVSLRDLPASVVDRLGLSDGSPFPGRSLAVYWDLPSAKLSAELTSPAFSEQTGQKEFGPRPGPGGFEPGVQMSIVSSGFHYIRNGAGDEQLYNIIKDPFEMSDVLKSADQRGQVIPFRRKLLEVLNENRGSVEVERGYLQGLRRSLATIVNRDSGTVANRAGPFGGPDS